MSKRQDVSNEISEMLNKLKPNVSDKEDRLDIVLNILEEHPRISGANYEFEMLDGQYNEEIEDLFSKFRRYKEDGIMPT